MSVIKTLSGKFDTILAIGDQHGPYHHRDTIPFLKAIKDLYSPDLVINIGDETDGHGWSYHDSDPSLSSPSHEFRKAKKYLHELYKVFPDMEIIESNHGSLYWRKQKSHGLPKEFFKSYNEAWEVPLTWSWSPAVIAKMSDGNLCYFHHGKNADVTKVSMSMGMSVVQGHYHEKMCVRHWASPIGEFWGAQTGCLVDNNSLAMAYNKLFLKTPLLGSLIIIEGQPVNIPMVTDKHNRWIGKIV